MSLTTTELRPWGSITTILESNDYKLRRIEIKANYSCNFISKHSHLHRIENIIIIGGVAEVSIDDKKYRLSQGESLYIPRFAKHKIENIGKILLVLLEYSSGEYLEEDDIIRYEE